MIRAALATFTRPVARPVIVTSTDLWCYVSLITGVAMAIALALDVANQLVFFVSWSAAVRSWSITVFTVTVTAVPVSLAMGIPQRDLLRAKARVEQLSRTDGLTGLLNRRALMQAVEQGGAEVAVLVIADIDRFKAVNDTYGHRTGDVVIRTVGRIMAAALGPLVQVGRLGGEEFAAIGRRDDLPEILAAIDAFREHMDKTAMCVAGQSFTVTISAGVAAREPGEAFDSLYAEADAALYAAKRSGRNQVACSPRLVARSIPGVGPLQSGPPSRQAAM